MYSTSDLNVSEPQTVALEPAWADGIIINWSNDFPFSSWKL